MAAPRAEAAGLAAGRHRPAVTWGSVASLPAAGMAARRIMRLAERHARSLRPLPRPAQRIGQWRVAQGLAPSTAGYGPLRDPPDWAFADGRPAPLWKGQQRRLRESEELAGSQRRPVRTSTDQ
ncbi:large ribosomal subunit protein mL52 isoform X3 [Calonectris borealis]|uniref:large ribosomal subunit protein mL52 isoform X3 n=1 Tax=Calonectris borealis TaxID=1323832 RepID=UPI003F4BFA3B